MFQEECFLCGDLQTIFQHHKHYFQVAQPPPDKSLDPYHLFVTQTLPKLGELPAFNLSPTDHELSPLLQQTRWHEYLQDAMKDPYIVSDIIQAIQIPKNQNNLWTKALHHLTDFPPIDGKAWHVLDNKETRHDYGRVVQSICLGVLRSLELPQRLKWFGVDAGDIARAQRLLACLKDGSCSPDVLVLHQFIKPFFYPQPIDDLTNWVPKWSQPIECFAMETEADIALHSQRSTPYRTICEYQRLASYLAYASPRPPTTLVSDDHMHITFEGKTLSIIKWRAALQQLPNDTDTLLKKILLDCDFNLVIPPHTPDIWSCTTPRYSYAIAAAFLPGEHHLLQCYLSQGLLRTVIEGNIIYDYAQIWAIMKTHDQLLEHMFSGDYHFTLATK
ncbi:hypothetical protein M422DRAFT_274327 [Sphaerobolus stellatus SS14]|uniref:Uncharacterized protein n=1 Tax=Sphaerobolus stellatus (strain SS14) TaxID=990650 RepID=A0A0C9UHC1_SPHS4|nr:hypothetical protein M422DRAFT_274327 [Sphaerobolus stellatus SS14]